MQQRVCPVRGRLRVPLTFGTVLIGLIAASAMLWWMAARLATTALGI